MKRSYLVLLLLFGVNFHCYSQIHIPGNSVVVQGYGSQVGGESIEFHSHLDYAREALIIRTNNEGRFIEWESAALPEKSGSKYVSFVWIAGVSGTMHGKEVSPMTVSVNGRRAASFVTAGEKSWSVAGKNGARLSFHEELRDGSDDRFGTMVLTVPLSMVEPGKPATLRITGEAPGRESWTMVFKEPLRYGGFEAEMVPLKYRGSEEQYVRVSLFHFGAPQEAEAMLEGRKTTYRLNFGNNTFDIPFAPVDSEKTARLVFSTADEVFERDVKLAPLRKWEANFMQITHTDIGYTRPQTDILAEHVRFLDYVLDYCDATDDYPDDAKFRWTCEGTWAVQEFFKSRPETEIQRFIRRVKEGRVELTAMYFNFDEMPDEQTLAASLAPLNLFRDYGVDEVRVAMQNDVNGIGWCFGEFFPEIGVKYLTMGVNLHKAVAPFDMPTYFWWESPSGKKILAYYGEHYMHGNGLGVNGTDFEAFERNFLRYINSMTGRGFAYDMLNIEFLGVGGDNSAPSTSASGIVKRWNDKYEWPKIRLSLFNESMDRFEARYANDIPTIRGAWPDWWTDGFASGAREAAATRISHSELIANQTGLAMAKLLGSDIPRHLLAQADEVNKAILFYDEHTFGFDASVSQPFCAETMQQRMVKASYAWESFRRTRLLGEATLGFLNQFVSKADVPSIAVFNPLSWERSGLVRTYVDFTIIPVDRKVKIVDEYGSVIKAQLDRRCHDGSYWYLWVENVPALGYKQYYVLPDDSPSVSTPGNGDLISNRWYDIQLDKANARILKWYDKELNTDLVDADAPWKMGELIHERLEWRFLDERRMDKHTRTLPSGVRFAGYRKGEIWDSYRFAAHTDAGIGDGENMYFELRVFNHVKRIDMAYGLTKKLDTDPEAVYVSFPFNLDGGKISFDVPGALIEAGIEQIQGTSNDWNNVQTHAVVKNDKAQIIMGSPEVPMMQFGNINTGRFRHEGKPESNNIYSFVMNNYWVTNFNADQHGEFEWKYFLTSTDDTSGEASTKFAWENRVPFLARAVPAGKSDKLRPSSAGILSIKPENILLVNMTPVPDENAVLLHLREVSGKPSRLEITSPAGLDIKAELSDVLGSKKEGDLSFQPYETRFVKIYW